MGIYYKSTHTGEPKTIAEVSAVMDKYGWSGGWRILDSKKIYSDHLVNDYPSTFIVDTATMKMIALTNYPKMELVKISQIVEIISEL